MSYKKAKTQNASLTHKDKFEKTGAKPSVLNAASYGAPPLPIGDMNVIKK